MRTININTTYNQITPIPNSFIDGYLPKAHPMFSVIYLFFYRHCLSGACSVTTSSVAESFKILETDVVNCLKYWEKTGLIRLSGEGEEYSIEFVPPEAAVPLDERPVKAPSARQAPARCGNVIPIAKAPPSGTALVPEAGGAAGAASAPASADSPLPVAAPPAARPISAETRPVYSVDELELYKAESSDVARLFSAAEQAFGKLHHYNDLCAVFGIYDWLRLPLEVIEKLFEYCAANGRLNMRYVERVAVDWAERGIDSADAADGYIAMFSGGYRDVMKALGRGGRAPAPKEQQYLDRWLGEFAMPLPVVLEACDRTIMNTDKRVFAYCDKILTDWHGKGVTSLEDAGRVSAEFDTGGGRAAPAPRRAASPARKPTRFANFEQRDVDFDEIERVERAYQELRRTERGLTS